MDDGTEAERWLGDPSLWRSALAGRLQEHLKAAPDYSRRTGA
jgi:hypothetical protein